MRRLARSALVVAPLVFACGGEDEADPPNGRPTDFELSPTLGSPVPDPGTEPAQRAWRGAGVDNGSPERAMAVGEVTDPGFPYIEDDSTGYWVFRAGSELEHIDLRVGGDAALLHLHAASDLTLGAEIQPSSFDTTTWIQGTWPVTPGEVYVVEVGVPGTGFF